MDVDSSNMTCLVFSSSFGSSDNFSVVFSLNDLQSNGSTQLQLSVAVASKPPPPPAAQPGDHIDLQEITTIGVAAGIVVSRVWGRGKLGFSLLMPPPQCSAGVVRHHRLLLLRRTAPRRQKGVRGLGFRV
jgi:hypothetical protein